MATTDVVREAVSSSQLTEGEQKTNKSGRPTRTYLDQCDIFLPTALNFRDAAEYTNIDLGAIGGAAAVALRAGRNAGVMPTGGQVAAAAGAQIIEGFGNLAEAFKNGFAEETAAVAAMRGASKLGFNGVAGAIETETGVTMNPNRRSTFKGIGLRRFNFSFQMIPTSATEARRIKEIIGFFRHNMYPEAGGLQAGDISQVLRFPSKFEIDATYGGKRIGSNILPCFLEHVNISYNPNAMAWHSDGEPQETVFDLAFIEERALTKSDIMKWNNSQGLRYLS